MMDLKRLFSILLLICGCSALAFSQRLELGLNAGAAGYIGDFNQDNLLQLNGPSGGIFGRVNIDPYWGVGLHYNFGKIKGDDILSNDASIRARNLNFRTTLHELSIQGNLNFLDIYAPGSKKRVSPFLFLGIGGVIFNPKFEDDSGLHKLRPYNTEGMATIYKNYALTIPYGVGVKYKKNENWTLFSQIGYRTTFTDYLDDVSGRYPERTVWNGLPNTYNEYLSYGSLYSSFQPGDQRGDFRKFDSYLFVNIGISYTFVGPKCFTF